MAGGDLISEDIRGSSPLMTTKDVILEMRGDLKKVAADVIELKKEHALVATALNAERELVTERRARMNEARASIDDRLDNHEHEIKQLNSWRAEAEGALRLAKWALGASLLATILMIFNLMEQLNPGV